MVITVHVPFLRPFLFGTIFFSLTLCLPPSYCIASLFFWMLDMYVARVFVCTVL